MIEEIDRIEGEEDSITGRFYSWNKGIVKFGKILVQFAMVPRVIEEIELPSGMLEIIWQELEIGMKVRIRAEMVVHGQHNVLFVSDDSTVDVA